MKRDVRILLLGEGEGRGAGGGSSSSGMGREARGAWRTWFSCGRGVKAGGVLQVPPPQSVVGPARLWPGGVTVTSRSVVSPLPPAAGPLKRCRTGANVNVLPSFPSPGGEDVPDHGSGGRGVS